MIGLPTVSAAVIRLQVDPVGHPSASSRKGAMSRSLDRHRSAAMVCLVTAMASLRMANRPVTESVDPQTAADTVSRTD